MPRRHATTTPDRTTPSSSLATPASPIVGAALAPVAVEPVERMDPVQPVERVEPVHAVERHAVPQALEPVAALIPVDAVKPWIAVPAPRPFAARFAAPRLQEPAPPGRAPHQPHGEGDDAAAERTATAPQLRRFIKSRAYVPMHELRRRFAINGGDDEVTPVDIERKRVFVGLPEREGQLLGELFRAGDIGYELSLDPISPIVVGVYPMRPVTRT